MRAGSGHVKYFIDFDLKFYACFSGAAAVLARAARSRVPCTPGKPALFVSGASTVENSMDKGHMHR